MKRFIRCVCILLVLAMVLPMTAFASSVENSRASSYFAVSSAFLKTTSGNTFQVCFNVTCVGSMDEIGANFIKVQQRASEEDEWETVKTYYKEDYPNIVDYGQVTHAATVTYTGTSGYGYRAYIELYAKKGTGEAFYPKYAYF